MVVAPNALAIRNYDTSSSANSLISNDTSLGFTVVAEVLPVSTSRSADISPLTLRGQARKGQRIVLAQRGFVFFEQTFARDGPFVIKEVVPLNDKTPVVFVLIDADGAQDSTKFSLLPGQRHALGDNAQSAPAQAKAGTSPAADDNDAPEFDASFLLGSALRSLSPAQLRSLGRARRVSGRGRGCARET